MERQPYSIRRARPEDAPVLAEAAREIAKAPGRLAPRPDEVKDEAFREKIAQISLDDVGLFVVLEQDGQSVGHALLERHKLAVTSHVAVLTIAVHEGHQGRGLGTALMRHLIDWAKAHPRIEKIELQVRSSNQRAITLYRKLGFVEEGRKTRRLKYGPDVYLDDIYMALWVGTYRDT